MAAILPSFVCAANRQDCHAGHAAGMRFLAASSRQQLVRLTWALRPPFFHPILSLLIQIELVSARRKFLRAGWSNKINLVFSTGPI
jgi:hypothetical protein